MIYRLSVETSKGSFFEDYPLRKDAEESMVGLGLASASGFAQSKNGGFSVRREHVIGAQIYEIEDLSGNRPEMPFNQLREEGW